MTSSIASWSNVAAACCLTLGAGCATSGSSTTSSFDAPPGAIDSYLSTKPASLHGYYRKVIEEGQRNETLNHMRAATAAMELDERGAAVESLDTALTIIESVYANTESAAKARSLWYEEGMKDFKGEPYERAMAYYYRGLLELELGNYDNARAHFKSGALQDAFAEEEQNRCDFALLIFLEGWASHLQGDRDLAAAAFKEVQQLRPNFPIPGEGDNVLVIAETGAAPRKLADGVGHYQLRFFRGKNFTDKRAALAFNDETVELFPIEDIAWQAMTRGGRAIDHILQGQVVFKQNQEDLGTLVTGLGEATMTAASVFNNASGELHAAAGGLELLGVAQLAISQRVKAKADTRAWDNLPDTVHIATFRAQDLPSQVTVRLLDENGTPTGAEQTRAVTPNADGSALVWARKPQSSVVSL